MQNIITAKFHNLRTNKRVDFIIDNDRIKPSKLLQYCLFSLMKGNKEFMLLDEQAVVYDMCIKTMKQCLKDLKKRTIIIQGGPGTGVPINTA